ncbi:MULTISPECIES: cell wall metabolism sensor histidine kinase WalK [Clostridia]|uniref:sensor histidine kinase n=1 Tax=Clostridia TaxID=186801 RepID=UPI00067F13BC|nr:MULTISPECIES: HAMP domain-containing sensor histidine kinase [Clostridia]
MTKTLQKKFITTAMLAITVLILVLLGAINGIYGLISGRQMERMLGMMVYNGGAPSLQPELPGGVRPGFLEQPIDEDTAMSARYFLIRYNSDGEAVQTDVSKIASVTETEAEKMAEKVRKSGSSEGRAKQFRYKIAQTHDGKGSVVIFLDTSSQTRNILMVLGISIFIGILCWSLMLLFVILLSKKAILPIAENIEKQKQFVTDAGHEIKTPLAIIMANTDAMELHNGENKWSRNIREQTVRLNGLMQNLLALAKMDEGAVKLPSSDILLSSLLEEILPAFYEPAALKEIIIEENIQPNIIMHGNRDSMSRLITILLDNAVKYTSKQGNIIIYLERKEGVITLSIKNTCDMLPEVDPEKLFDRFYRGDSARTQKSGGYGIGLSAARAIAESQKGSITASYEENQIIFTVELKNSK